MGFREVVAARKAKETEEMASKARALGCGPPGASDDIGWGDLSDEGTRLFRNFDAEQGRLAKRCYWRVLFNRAWRSAQPSVEAAIVGADGGALIAAREAGVESPQGAAAPGDLGQAVDAKVDLLRPDGHQGRAPGASAGDGAGAEVTGRGRSRRRGPARSARGGPSS